MPTKTTKFGTSKREGHDASDFYKRNLYAEKDASLPPLVPVNNTTHDVRNGTEAAGEWRDQIYQHSAVSMVHLPNDSVGMAFTSPPYNVGKDYDPDLDMQAYLALIEQVGREVHRVLLPGGRYVVNIANLGRKPYIPLHAHFYEVHQRIGFLPMGEIIWQKGKGASGNCAWGSWMSAKAPRLRDLHEYLLVFSKGSFSRPTKANPISAVKSLCNPHSPFGRFHPNLPSASGIPHPFRWRWQNA